MEILADILKHRAGQLVNYSKLACDVNISIDTARRWISTLESFYFCFIVRPWFINIPKSLRKQPMIYLWDWSVIPDEGTQ